MSLELVGKDLFKVCTGPVRTEYTRWGGTLVRVCDIFGIGVRGRNYFFLHACY